MDEVSDVDPKIICAVLLSDGAIREMGTGKLTIFGLFGGWNCPAFPFAAPPFFITVSMANFPPETKAINVVARIEQKLTGLVIGNCAALIQFPPGSGLDRNMVIDVPLPVAGVQIPGPGSYRVVVLVNDHQLDQRHVQVNLAKPLPTPFPPPSP